MKQKRCKNKRLSAQLQLTPQTFFSDLDQYESCLPSPASINYSSSLTYESLKNNFQAPMKSIQANILARNHQIEAKKSLLKTQLLGAIQKPCIVEFKQSTSTNDRSNCFFDSKVQDESLVNFESADEKLDVCDRIKICHQGNSGIICLMLEQAGFVTDKKWKKKVVKKMMQTVWSNWFTVVFIHQLEGYSLYGQKKEAFIKIMGDEIFPNIIEKNRVLSNFQYDWINRRLKDASLGSKPDAMIIYN